MHALARRGAPRLAVLVVTLLAVVGLTAACTPLNTQEQYVFKSVNDLRTANRVQPVYEYEPLTAKARAWAAALAAQGQLAHSDLKALGVGWSMAAENVGRSSSIEDVFARLAASPDHRTNMLNAAYQLTGIGTARSKDGTVYLVQLFIRS